jgi:hypothetical protein
MGLSSEPAQLGHKHAKASNLNKDRLPSESLYFHFSEEKSHHKRKSAKMPQIELLFHQCQPMIAQDKLTLKWDWAAFK